MIFAFIVKLFLGVFALLGLYSTVHWVAQRFFGSRRTILAIEILTQRDAESAEVLIRDALFSALGLPSERVVVLTTKGLAESAGLKKILRRYGVSCYFLQEKDINFK